MTNVAGWSGGNQSPREIRDGTSASHSVGLDVRGLRRGGWQLARVIDRELPFCGKLLWVKGPPECFTVDGVEVRTIRTNVRLRGRSVYIRLASVELTRGVTRQAHPRDLEAATCRKPSKVNPHAIAVNRLTDCFAQEGRLHA